MKVKERVHCTKFVKYFSPPDVQARTLGPTQTKINNVHKGTPKVKPFIRKMKTFLILDFGKIAFGHGDVW